MSILSKIFGTKSDNSTHINNVRKESLKCKCNSVSNHREYVDTAGEIVVECTICKHFIKFPKS